MSAEPIERYQALFDEAHEAGSGDTSERAHQRSKERLLTALAADEVLPKARPWMLMAAGTFALAALLMLVLWPSQTLTYEVEGAALSSSYLAPDGQSVSVRFSDGSAVRLEDGARGRIAEVTNRGAHLLLERGAAHLLVMHLPEADWAVVAGPYTVRVTGTEFDVRYRPDDKSLEVAMQEGSVEVVGPLASGGIAVVAGQRLVARDGELRIEAIASSSAKSDAPAARQPAPAHRAPSDSEAMPPSNSAAAKAAGSAVKPPKSWAEQVAAGDFEGVVKQAEARGIAAVLSGASLEELVALADAARYVGRGGLAQKALLAQRKRYAGTNAAASAAFLLARMADQGGSSARAIELYDAYLAEAPGGSFSEAALGRKMLAQQRAGQSAAARATAQSYLGRYPAGGHAKAAGDLLQQKP